MISLIVLLSLSADYLASEETLNAGIEGYKARCAAVRKKVIAVIEDASVKQAKRLSQARKGKVTSALVGTGEESIESADGSWQFATATDKAKEITALSNGIELWRSLLSDLKAKKVYPQIGSTFVSPGGCGCIVGPVKILNRAHGRIAAVLITRNVPRYRSDNCIFESFENELAQPGEICKAMAVYQFVGLENDCPVFRLVKQLPTGSAKCLFTDEGEFHPLWNE